MKFELPKLPYEVSALNPSISDRTIEFHYGKHHQTYVNNLNNLIPGTKFEDADLETIIREAEGPIFNNAAQVWNHTFYFNQFSPKPCTHPKGELAKAIDRQFGSFEKFKEEFTKASVGLFGSGWTWLVKNDDGSLDIVPESNAGTPLRKGKKPILTCDVWEHAYYLDYQNRRPDYVTNFWNILDWDVISDRY
jgi:Fe-Mn family superoxide dismutase